MRIQKKNNVGKRKTGVLKGMLIRDPVDISAISDKISSSSFKAP